NSQVLDHILFSGSLFTRRFVYDPVHVKAEFRDRASDHDPVGRPRDTEPAADGCGQRPVHREGGTVQLAATADTATVNVTNVAPTATFSAPATAFAGFSFTLTLARRMLRRLTRPPASRTRSTAALATGRSAPHRAHRARRAMS